MQVYHGDGALTPTAKRIERLESLWRMFLGIYGPEHPLTVRARERLDEAVQTMRELRGAA